jgi:hypothetical protein
MQDRKLWNITAALVCVGLFYVGHGLHNRGGDGMLRAVQNGGAGRPNLVALVG